MCGWTHIHTHTHTAIMTNYFCKPMIDFHSWKTGLHPRFATGDRHDGWVLSRITLQIELSTAWVVFIPPFPHICRDNTKQGQLIVVSWWHLVVMLPSLWVLPWAVKLAPGLVSSLLCLFAFYSPFVSAQSSSRGRQNLVSSAHSSLPCSVWRKSS